MTMSFLFAQEQAELVFAEGEGFTLVRQGDSVFYDLYEEPVEGMVLMTGDVILTEQDTWLEIEINQTGSLIKIAENTTFSINSLESQGGVFKVSYGRIRARVRKLTDDSPFWVQGTDTVAGVRGTDFGYDIFYKREAPEQTRTDVYCFEGSVEVVKQLDDTEEPEAFASVILGRNEMVTVFSDSQETLEKEKVTAELKEYWGEKDFQYEPVLSDKSSFIKTFHNDTKQLKQAALFSAGTGVLIGGIGIASYLWADASGGTAIGLGSIGGFLVGTGGYFFIRALVLDRQTEKGITTP
jgi:hypothetical protein